ncbi:MAG: DNA (cytosine-5-)-methyltransferase, partial [Haemophilus parainfluenzae]|nr:DNA (cytosine-5-)-methyltransferase [Haemophilus parainfluenzae]
MELFTFGSVCSGIEAVSVAWKGLGKPLWFSEIEPFPCAVLTYHYPNIPNLGDMADLPQKIINREIPAPDVLVGGTPCQAFSVAGLRNSLDDERGNLTLTLIHILEAIDYVRFQDDKPPCILLWENVPGVLSTKDNAFGHFLAGLAQEREPLQPTGGKWSNAGYVHSTRTVVWRTLDAQYFGLAQRRKRVFVVASARQRSVAQILIEPKGLCGDIEAGKATTESFTSYAESCFGTYCQSKVSGVLKASGGNLGEGSETLVVHGAQDSIPPIKIARFLGCNAELDNMLFDIAHRSDVVRIQDAGTTPTLTARMGTGGNNIPCISINQNIRKLTPSECEKLQGFPPG